MYQSPQKLHGVKPMMSFMTESESESSSLPRFSRRVPQFLSPVTPSPSVRASKLLKSYHERRHDLQHLQSYHERRHDPSLARVGIREANCVCSSKSQPASFVFGHRTLADPQQISLHLPRGVTGPIREL